MSFIFPLDSLPPPHPVEVNTGESSLIRPGDLPDSPEGVRGGGRGDGGGQTNREKFARIFISIDLMLFLMDEWLLYS